MRRFLLLIGAVTGAIGAVGVSSILAAAVSSATVRPNVAEQMTEASFSLTGYVAGKVRRAGSHDQVTFVFTMQNIGTSLANQFLVVTNVTNATIEDQSCVDGDFGTIFDSDGTSCEPGLLAPGQSESTVVSIIVTGEGPRTVSVRACSVNGSTGRRGPCRTLSIYAPA
jgi:hypothetical protein